MIDSESPLQVDYGETLPQGPDVPPELQTEVRTAVSKALESADDSPAGKRLTKLREKLESGEISDVIDGDWVAQCYAAKLSEGDTSPVIRKSDIHGRAIVITLEQMRDIMAFSYIDPAGDMQCFDQQMMEDAGTTAIVVFPGELGD